MIKTGKFLLIVWGLLFLAIFATADQIYALKAGRLIDGQNAEVRRDVIIVIQGNKITAIGEKAAVPKDAVLVDLSDKTLPSPSSSSKRRGWWMTRCACTCTR